MIQPKRNDPWL